MTHAGAAALQPDAVSLEIINHILQTESYLSTLTDKSPQPMLNTMLTRLVEMVSPTRDTALVESVLKNKAVSEKLALLRNSLSDCEYALEKNWGDKIVAESTSYTCYPYINHYRALVSAEVSVLENHLAINDQNFCFIGSGPMPITAFEMKKDYPGISLSCVEMTEAAIEVSKKISGLSNLHVDHIHAKAEECDYANFDFILMASMTRGKKSVMEKIEQTAKNNIIIAIRSVEELRHILYEPVNLDDIPASFSYLGKTSYKQEHVNTTLFYRLTKN